jgi:hypothetical protein
MFVTSLHPYTKNEAMETPDAAGKDFKSPRIEIAPIP